jgi:hypothetical protein
MDCLDPWHLLGLAGIQRDEASVSMGRSQDNGVQHAGAINVETVFGAAGGFFGAVQALNSRAQEASFFRPGICHG